MKISTEEIRQACIKALGEPMAPTVKPVHPSTYAALKAQGLIHEAINEAILGFNIVTNEHIPEGHIGLFSDDGNAFIIRIEES